MLSALKLPGFRWVAALYALDYLVELAAAIALMVLVYDATDSPVAASMMLLCKQVAPGVVMGVLAQRLERVPVRLGLASAYATAAAALAVLATTGYGITLFVVAFVAGVTGAVVRSLLRVVVARSLAGDDRRAANGVLNVLMGTVALLGPALGGLVVALASARSGLAIMAAASALLSMLSLAMPRVLVVGSELPTAAPEAWGEDAPRAPATSRTPAWLLLAVGGLVLALFSMDEPALLAYAREGLGSDVDGYAAILVAWGIGMMLGGIGYARLLDRSMTAVFGWGAGLGAVGYLGLGLAPNLTSAVAVAVVGGLGNGVFWVALVTAVQEMAGAHRQAQWAARLESIATAAPAVGVLAGGLVAELISARATLLLPGAIALLVLVLWGLSTRLSEARAVRSLEPAPALNGSDLVA